MASLAAPPAFPEALKKRSRILSTESFELTPRLKRCRGGASEFGANDVLDEEHSTAKDVPKFTQRHVDYFEQVKQAEIARIRTEYEQYIMKKEVESQHMRAELNRLQEVAQNQDRELQRLQSESKLLKRAITIQNQQKEECQQENTMLKTLASQAAEHIKRLEQTNYALRVHLQTSTSAGIGPSSQPPDVF